MNKKMTKTFFYNIKPNVKYLITLSSIRELEYRGYSRLTIVMGEKILYTYSLYSFVDSNIVFYDKKAKKLYRFENKSMIFKIFKWILIGFIILLLLAIVALLLKKYYFNKPTVTKTG